MRRASLKGRKAAGSTSRKETALKRKWPLLVLAILGGGSLTLLALVLFAYQYGSQPSVPHMGLAAGFGAAIGGALTRI